MKLLGTLFNMFIALFIFWIVVLCGCIIASAFGANVDARLLLLSVIFIMMSFAGAIAIIQIEDNRLNK